MIELDLQLRRTAAPCHAPAALVLRGGDAAAWLAALSRWPGAPVGWRLYAIPDARHDHLTGGLLAIPPPGGLPPDPGAAQVYGCIGGRLYLPVDARLTPALPPDELPRLLPYPVQLYQPGHGLVAFEATDALDPQSLVRPPARRPGRWHLAQPGVPRPPGLLLVETPAPTSGEILERGQDDIGSTPIEDVPTERDASGEGIGESLRNLERRLLDSLRKVMPEPSADQKSGRSKSGRKGALAGAVQNWMRNRLEELERLRHKEVNRLLGLLDSNPDEGLRYAIPLSTPYQPRGVAPPSGALSRHDTQFSVGGLGGGGMVDSWRIREDIYRQLRQKYLTAANRELALGRYERAAYIFAHLLGDYHAAANALQQGKFYREAAVLYRDHLKQPLAAAECLERGGLLTEAIDLYIDADKYEKAGDLYCQIGRPDKAEPCYRTAAEQAVRARSDHLRAAAILEHKLHDPDEALRVLRAGWPDSAQAEACLKELFLLLGRLGRHDDATHRLQRLVDTPMQDRDVQRFASALGELQRAYPQPAFRESCADTARVVIGGRLPTIADPGHARRLLDVLRSLVPDDDLLARDCLRYLNLMRRPPAPRETLEHPQSGIVRAPLSTFRLLEMTTCLDAQPCLNGYVVLGRGQRSIVLVRGDWHTTQSLRWELDEETGPDPMLTTDQTTGRWAVLLPRQGRFLPPQSLPGTDIFAEELLAGTPEWLRDNTLAVATAENRRFVALQVDHSVFLLSDFSSAGELLATHQIELQAHFPEPPLGRPLLQARRGDVYIAWGHQLLRYAESGAVNTLDLPGRAHLFCASAQFTRGRLAVATDHGCVITWPEIAGIDTRVVTFAEDMVVTAMAFLPGGNLVVAGHNQARLYNTQNWKLVYAMSFHMEGTVTGVVHLGTGNDFALFSATGSVSLYRSA